MLEQKFRSYYQEILVNRCAKLILHKLTPNQLTIIAGLSGVLVIPCLYWHFNLLAVILLAISGFLDTLDGTLARLMGSSSKYGSALDITVDRVVEFSAMFGLYLAGADRGAYSLLMVGSSLFCVTTFLVVGIFTPNDSHKSFHYSDGLMERAEAFIIYGIMMLFPFSFKPLAVIYILLVSLTGIIRLYQFKQYCA